ncbi:MAG TPA: sensor domain-containing diguanylate cyclase [Chloroflexi bacterium]|nr:sensor domain-containing diguanylate cyclase [Chloroflexota bacterium]
MKQLTPTLAWKYLRLMIYVAAIATAYLRRFIRYTFLHEHISFTLLSVGTDVLVAILVLEAGWWWLGTIYRRMWRRLEVTHQNANRFRALFRFSETLGKQTDETSFYRNTVEGLHNLFEFREVRIYRSLPDRQTWALQAFAGHDPLPAEWRLPIESEGILSVFAQDTLFYVPDVSTRDFSFSWLRQGSEILMALRSGGRVAALLVVVRPEKGAFSDEDLNILRVTANLAAATLQRIHSTQTQERRAQELLALQETMSDILAERELTPLLNAILERAITLLHASGGDLGLYNPENGATEIVVSRNLGKDSIGKMLSLGEGAMGWVARYRKPISIPDYTLWEHRSPQYLLPPHTSVLAVPLEASGKFIGSVGITKENSPLPFDENDLKLLTRFAQQAALALETTRLYQQAIRDGEKRKALYEASQHIAAALSTEKIYQAIHKAVKRLMPADTFILTLADYQQGIIKPVYVFDNGQRYQEKPILITSGLSGYVIALGKAVHIPDMEAFEKVNAGQVHHFGTPRRVRSILAVPLYEKGRVAGVLSAQSYRSHAYDKEDEQLLEMLANQAAITLENARLFARMREMAIRDALTGVFNRHYLFRRAAYELARAQRYQRPLGVIMLDVDHFKKINDTYGHGVGDQALRVIAETCRSALRKSDILGRYGGEEFVILLPETAIETTRHVANRLRAIIDAQTIATDAGQISITISIGITAYLPTDETLETIFRRADQALYMAKHRGRNRVCQMLRDEPEP